MTLPAVLAALGYTVAALLCCYVLYKLIVRHWRKEGDTVESYKLPCVALSISRKQSCCTREEFRKIVREQINNDETVKSVSPLGSAMFIIEIDLRDFSKFESEYGEVVNIVRHFINLSIPNPPLPKSPRQE
ncbi:MAG: hypothetical protein WBL40_02035, partial [Terrimicrobiaceae bacterium]